MTQPSEAFGTLRLMSNREDILRMLELFEEIVKYAYDGTLGERAALHACGQAAHEGMLVADRELRRIFEFEGTQHYPKAVALRVRPRLRAI